MKLIERGRWTTLPNGGAIRIEADGRVTYKPAAAKRNPSHRKTKKADAKRMKRGNTALRAWVKAGGQFPERSKRKR